MHYDQVRPALYPDTGDIEDFSYGRVERLLSFVRGEPASDFSGTEGFEVFSGRVQPHAPGLDRRMWYGGASLRSAQWAGRNGMNFLTSSVVKAEEPGDFAELQLAHIRTFRAHHRDGDRARVSQGLVLIPTDTAREGHQVTVLERDPAAPPSPKHADAAWEDWQRRGVSQFRLPHFMMPRWRSLLRTELPEVRYPLEAAGARHLNTLADLPAARRGPLRDGDERFDTVTARRPVLEAALTAAAEAAGVTIWRGVTVTGLTTDGHAGVPRVTGVLTENGAAVTADLRLRLLRPAFPLAARGTADGAR